MTDQALVSQFHDQLKATVKKHALNDLDEPILESLSRHFELLKKWNKTHNLIAVEDTRSLIEEHYVDCLLALSLVLPRVQTDRLIHDLGSGNGFPGLLGAIISKRHRFTLVESLRKKCSFLRTVKTELALSNLVIEQKRVQDLGGISIAISRAAFSDHMISELAASFEPKGRLFLMRTPSKNFSELIAKGPWAVVDQLDYKLDTGAERCVVVLEKNTSST